MAKSRRNNKRPKYSKARQIHKYRTLIKSYQNKGKLKDEIKAIGKVTRSDSFVQHALLALLIGVVIYEAIWGEGLSFEKPGLRNLSLLLVLSAFSIPPLFQVSIRQEIKRSTANNESPDKIREYWRKINWLNFISVTTFWVGMVIGDYINEDYSATAMAVFLGTSILILAKGMMIVATMRPYLIFSALFVHMYEGLRKTSHFALMLLILSFSSPNYTPDYFSILLLLLVFFALDIIMRKLFPGRYFSVLEDKVIRYAEINALMLTFSNYANRLLKKKSAENDLRIRLKNNDHDYIQAFVAKAKEIQGISKVGRFLSYFLVGAIVYLAILIFESISEGLIQDMFNNSIKEFLCDKINILCN